MKIKSLRISNVLSFKHFDDISHAEPVVFEDGLNIIIGENGAGKSTALEVINFLFKRVLYKQFSVNQDLYSQKNSIPIADKKNTLFPTNTQTFSNFRLEPNWDTPDKDPKIRLEICLDDIDLQNIKHLKDNEVKLNSVASLYASRGNASLVNSQTTYTLDITLHKNTNSFTLSFVNCTQDFGYEYLSDYNFYKELIVLHNLENPSDLITPLYESFTLISGYRNYHTFSKSISLKDQDPYQQIQTIRNQDFSKSLNANDASEPSIFGLVRLRIAEKHFGLISQKLSESECEAEANNLPFIVSINKKLKIINLECRIKLIDLRTWQYSFQFFDTRRKKILENINSLSAGQKAIIHLVFEAYGRGDLKGGLVIIDEPEIHLHYQFQNQYLQVIRELNKEQSCQYILVTHSEALINSSTINQVRRFSLNSSGYTEIKSPTLSTDERILIKILDNTRSTYAFFSRKVLLVEGDTDRYFYKSIIQEKYPEFDQEIAVLYMGGKGGYAEWSKLFKSFGLLVYFIGDFDCTIDLFYPNEKGTKLNTSADIAAFKGRNTDWETKIDNEYTNKIYILKNGNLEHYLNLPKKGLTETIDFCNTNLINYLSDNTNDESKEIREIIKQISI